MFARALELVKGNPKNVQNSFHWNEVFLNIPSAINYDPGLPRVRLVRQDSKRAAEIIPFFTTERYMVLLVDWRTLWFIKIAQDFNI